MSAVLRPRFPRPILAHVALPEGTASIRALKSALNGTRCVCVLIDRGTKHPSIDLSLTPGAARRLARELIKHAVEIGASLDD